MLFNCGWIGDAHCPQCQSPSMQLSFVKRCNQMEKDAKETADNLLSVARMEAERILAESRIESRCRTVDTGTQTDAVHTGKSPLFNSDPLYSWGPVVLLVSKVARRSPGRVGTVLHVHCIKPSEKRKGSTTTASSYVRHNTSWRGSQPENLTWSHLKTRVGAHMGIARWLSNDGYVLKSSTRKT
jgi:hypothetical protein